MSSNCSHCGKIIDSKNKRKIFCSNSCKTLNFRKKKGIPDPLFLEKHIAKEKIEKTRTVTTKVENEFWQRQNQVVNEWQSYYDKLLDKKNKIYKEYIELRDYDVPTNKMIQGGIMGALGGAALGTGINSIKKERNRELVEGLGLIVMLFGAAQGYKSGKEQQQNELVERNNRLNELARKSNSLDPQINDALYNLHNQRLHLSTITKLIDKEVNEVYYEYIPIQINTLEAEKIALKLKPIKQEKSLVLSSTHFQEKEFKTYKLNEEYLNLFGSNLPIGANVLVYGESGQGKSTWTIELANYISNNLGSVLYNSSEEGIGETLQRKFKGKSSDYLDISEAKTYDSLKKALKSKKYAFLIIDSVNDMDIKPSQLKELKLDDPNRSVIYIMQATKGGDYKGSTEYRHDADYVVKIENFSAIREKGR